MGRGDSWNSNIYFNSILEINIQVEQTEVYKNWEYQFIEKIEQIDFKGVIYCDVRVIK